MEAKLSSAADIADAFAAGADPDRDAAMRRLLYLGARASGAEHVSLYWDVRRTVERIDAAGLSDERELPAEWLEKRLWPWLHAYPTGAPARILRADAHGAPAPLDRRRSAAILPLDDTEPCLAGMLYLEFEPPRLEQFLDTWSEDAVNYADLVQSWLHSELDADTGVLSADAFALEIRRWTAHADQRRRRAVVLRLRFRFLAEVERRLGRDRAVAVLRELKVLVRSRMRHRDLLARTGRHSFGLLLRHCTPSDAERAAETLTNILKDYRFSDGRVQVPAEFTIDLRPVRGGFDADDAPYDASVHGWSAATVRRSYDGRRAADGRHRAKLAPNDGRQRELPLASPSTREGRDTSNVVELEGHRRGDRDDVAVRGAAARFADTSTPVDLAAPRLRVQPCIRLGSQGPPLFLRLRGFTRIESNLPTECDDDGWRRIAGVLDVVQQSLQDGRQVRWLLPLAERQLTVTTVDAIAEGATARAIDPERLLLGVRVGGWQQAATRDAAFVARLTGTGLAVLLDAAHEPVADARSLAALGASIWGIALSARQVGRRDAHVAAIDGLAREVERLRTIGLRVVCGGIDTRAARRLCTQLGVDGGWGRACAVTRPLESSRSSP